MMHRKLAPTSLLDPSLRAATIGAVALVSVLAFEAMAVATAMPAVAEALDGLSLYGLAFGASLAASVMGMVASGILADRRGPAVPFGAGVTLFVVGLLVAGTAASMPVLVAGRAVQGLGVGMTIVALYLLVDIYPDDLQPRVFAAFSAAWVIPALVGPAIAGLLVEHLHWRAVFLVVTVIAVPAGAMVNRSMPRAPRRVDGPRWSPADRRRLALAVAISFGVGAIHLTAQAESFEARIGLVVALLATAVASRQLLPSGTLRLRPGLPAVVALRGLGGAAFFAAEVLIPLLLTTQRGLSATLAGMVLTGGALGWAAGSWAQGHWHRPGTRWARRGTLALTLGIAGLASALWPAIPILVAVASWALAGSGMGMLYPTLSVQVLRLSDTDEQGENVASLQLADAVATSVALAATGTLLAVGGATPRVFAAGLAIAVAIAALTTLAVPRLTPST